MKALQPLKIAVLAALVIFASCKKGSNTPNNPNNPASGPFVAKVDGSAFPQASLSLTKAKYVTSTKMLQIIGQPADQKEGIILSLMPFGTDFTYWQPGTYNFDPANVSGLKYMASAEYNKWSGNGYDQWFTKWDYVKSGQIVIESISKTHVKGTFSFDAVKSNNNGTFNASNVKKITAGTFDLDISSI